MGTLDGKVVLISGTAGGQGRAAARAFAREGARVMGCDVKESEAQETVGCCQSNANLSLICQEAPESYSKLTPFSQSGRAVLLEGFAWCELSVEVDMVVDRGMRGSTLLKGLDVPEFRHRAFSSPEWLV